EHDFGALAGQRTVGLREAAVVADEAADLRTAHFADGKATVAGGEVALLHDGERAVGLRLGVAGDVDLAVEAEALPSRAEEGHAVVDAFARGFGEAERDAHLVPGEGFGDALEGVVDLPGVGV